MSELTVKSAVDLLSMLRSKSISSFELIHEHLREIQRLNPLLRAFVDVHEEEVVRAAKSADTRRAQGSYSDDTLPLLGLPLSIKSSIRVAGHLCETGSVLHRGFRPPEDATAVRLLRDAGAVILGTTNCPEFLMAYETDNLLHGATCNPWNPQYQAGGSSGGESAAIAAGLSAAGLGSDSGGSVRVPAHFTGICALKPTSGCISSIGHTLPCVGPFATLGAIGPMARRIADISLLFDVLADTRKAATIKDSALKTRPIGFLVDDGLVPVCAETTAAIQTAVQALEARGFDIVPFASSHLEAARHLWQEFFVRCGRELLEPVIAEREDELSPTFQYFLDYARTRPVITAREVLTAWARADQLRELLNAELAAYCAILTPVASTPAFRHGERACILGNQTVGYFDAMRFTQWFNLLGAPAAVVPITRSKDGLPIGIQVASSPNTDETVLRIAAYLDQDFGYVPPPISLPASRSPSQ